MNQPKAFIPHYKRDGNEVVMEFEETFYDRSGNKALLTKVLYKTKKGNFHQETIRVKWLEFVNIRPYSIKVISQDVESRQDDYFVECENHFITSEISSLKVDERLYYQPYHLIHIKSHVFQRLVEENLVDKVPEGQSCPEDIYYHALVVFDTNGNKRTLRFFEREKLEEAVKILSK